MHDWGGGPAALLQAQAHTRAGGRHLHCCRFGDDRRRLCSGRCGGLSQKDDHRSCRASHVKCAGFEVGAKPIAVGNSALIYRSKSGDCGAKWALSAEQKITSAVVSEFFNIGRRNRSPGWRCRHLSIGMPTLVGNASGDRMLSGATRAGPQIIRHPSSRREAMPARMCSHVEGGRARGRQRRGDEYRGERGDWLGGQGEILFLCESMTPIVKRWNTATAADIASMGIQVRGRTGFADERRRPNTCVIRASG